MTTEWKIGMIVEFGRTHGEKTQGKIVKVNPKKLKVEQIGSRGRQKSHREGTVWTVPRSLCKVISDIDTSTTGEKGVGKTFVPDNTDTAHLNKHLVNPDGSAMTTDDAMWRISGIHCELSPENLTCDGELDGASIRRKSRRLNGELRTLERFVGRKVDECEAWDFTQNTTSKPPKSLWELKFGC